MTRQASTLDQRLLTEAVRFHEDASGGVVDDTIAEGLAREAGGDFEHRLIVRARSLTITRSIADALNQLRASLRLIVAVALGLAAIAGAGAARVALGAHADTPVNVFWVLGGILGPHVIALLIWVGVMFMGSGALAASSLGGLVFAVGRRLSYRLHKGPAHLAAIRATLSVYAQTALGRWTISAVSHALWLAFLSAALLILILILSTKQYSFVWETTILSEKAYVALTRALALAPEALGFSAPSVAQITASQWPAPGGAPAGADKAWSGLLVGAILVYGILIRLVLMIACLIARWRAIARFRLDTSALAYTRLYSRLMPGSASMGVIDPDDEASTKPAEHCEPPPTPMRADAPTAIVGFEIEPPGSSWPPAVDHIDWLDLGIVNGREDRDQALQTLRATPVRLVTLVCAATATPDRGSHAFLNALQRASEAPLALVLTGGQRLRERARGDDVQQRLADWRRLASDAKVPEERVIDCDLEHWTPASRERLARLLGATISTKSPSSRIQAAFDVIVEHVARWTHQPEMSEQAELHRAIAKLYQNERDIWQALLPQRAKAAGNVTDQVKASADRMANLLPSHLRANPRWLTAGAMAGALGCVAAATMVAPAAITALPLWAGLGSAVSMAVSGVSRKTQANKNDGEIPHDYGTAVSSAALFSLVLELQGHDETVITRVLEQVIDDDPVIEDADSARQWLRVLRRRFDSAREDEARP